MTIIRKGYFCARISNIISKLSTKGFKIVLRLTWGSIKSYKITNFVANLQFKAQTLPYTYSYIPIFITINVKYFCNVYRLQGVLY